MTFRKTNVNLLKLIQVMFKHLFYMLLLLALVSVTACHKTCDTSQDTTTEPEGELIGGFPRDSLGTATIPVWNSGTLESREDCCDTICPNNFVVSVIPYTKTTCQCLNGYLVFNEPGCPDTSALVRSSSGTQQAPTGFNSICAGSEIRLCLDWFDEAPFCEKSCMSGLILLSANGVPFQFYPFCFDVADGPVCITLGKVECCQANNSNCRWVYNTNYLDGTVDCAPCGDEYNCTTD